MATDTAAQPSGAALPPVTVARFAEGMRLMEALVDENADMFVRRGQEYRDAYRDGTSRPLNALETAQIAAALGTSLQDAADQIASVDLAHHDEPQPAEVLLAAGVATAPAFLDAVLRFAALLELDDATFEHARESDTLAAALDEHAKQYDALTLTEMRARAAAAMEHLAAASGVEPGKAWTTIGQSVWKALEAAADRLGTTMRSSSSIASATPTADSPPTTSSTA